jgi:hypothetical protein
MSELNSSSPSNATIRYTDNPKYGFSGTAKGEGGSTFYIKLDNINPAFSFTIDPSGKWEWTPPFDLSQGLHNFSLYIIDKAGNIGGISQVTLDVDLTPPNAPLLLTIYDDQGTPELILAGGRTDDSRPTFTGVGEPGDTIKMYDGESRTVIGSAIVQDNGVWTIEPTSDMPEKAYDLRFEATDRFDRTGAASEPIALTIGPDGAGAKEGAEILWADDNAGSNHSRLGDGATTDDFTPTFTGKAAANSLVTIYRQGTTTPLGSVYAEPNGHWTFTPTTQTASTHSYYAISDADGKASPNFTLTFDPTSDAFATVTIDSMTHDSGSSNNDWLTNNGAAGRQVSGSLDKALRLGEKVQISTDGKTWVDAEVNGQRWNVIDTLAHTSSWAIQARVVSEDGLKISTPITQQVTLDTTAPTLPVKVSASELGLMVVLSEDVVAGDTIKAFIADHPITYTLTANDITAGRVTLDIPPQYIDAVKNGNITVGAALVDQAGNGSAYRAVTYKEGDPRDMGVGFNGLDDNGFSGTFNFNSDGMKFKFGGSSNGSLLGSITTAEYVVGDVIKKSTYVGVYANLGPTYQAKGTLVASLQDGLYGNTVSLKIHTRVSSTFGGGKSTITFYENIDGTNKAVLTKDLPTGTGIKLIDGKNYPVFQDLTYTAPEGKTFSSFTISTNIITNYGSDSLVFVDDILFSGGNIAAGEETILPPDANETFTGLDTLAESHNDQADIYALENISYQFEQGPQFNTLTLTGQNDTLDLSQISSQIAQAEIIDITGIGNNILTLNIKDLLSHGEKDLFIADGQTQLMIKGDKGDVVDLTQLIDGDSPQSWIEEGSVIIAGVNYQVYHEANKDVDLLLQEGIQVNLI